MNNEKQMSVHEMAQYREKLIKQKEFLTDILSKIEEQILALQVERLHLKNTLLGTDYPGRQTISDKHTSAKSTNKKNESITKNPKSLTEEELDLSVPQFLNNSEEESEEEEKED